MWVGYVLGQVASFFLTLLRMLPLAIANRLSRTRIPQDGDVVISLTSHGKRLNKVHFTLESIARGYTKAPNMTTTPLCPSACNDWSTAGYKSAVPMATTAPTPNTGTNSATLQAQASALPPSMTT